VVVGPRYPPPPDIYTGSPFITVTPTQPRRRRAPPPVAALPIPRGQLELVFAGEENAIYVSPTSLRRTAEAADLTMLMIPLKARDGLSYLVGRAHADCVRRTVRVSGLSGYRDNGVLLGVSGRGAAPPMGVGSGGYRLLERACDEDADAVRLRLDGPEKALQVTRRGMDTLSMPPDGFDGFGLPLPTGRLAAYAINSMGGADFVDLDSIRPDGGGLRARILRVAEIPLEARGREAALIVTEVKVDCARKRAWIRLTAEFDADRRYITELPGEGPDLPGLHGLTTLAFGLICGVDRPGEGQLAQGLDEAVALSRKSARREHGRVTS
jgi:hypothetical protein